MQEVAIPALRGTAILGLPLSGSVIGSHLLLSAAGPTLCYLPPTGCPHRAKRLLPPLALPSFPPSPSELRACPCSELVRAVSSRVYGATRCLQAFNHTAQDNTRQLHLGHGKFNFSSDVSLLPTLNTIVPYDITCLGTLLTTIIATTLFQNVDRQIILPRCNVRELLTPCFDLQVNSGAVHMIASYPFEIVKYLMDRTVFSNLSHIITSQYDQNSRTSSAFRMPTQASAEMQRMPASTRQAGQERMPRSTPRTLSCF